MSNKIIYIGFVTATLILSAPYIWLILDILDRNSYDKILIDACLSGPCLILTVLIWCFAVKLEKLKKQKNNWSILKFKSDKRNLRGAFSP